MINLFVHFVPGCSRLRAETLESRLAQQNTTIRTTSTNPTMTVTVASTRMSDATCTTSSRCSTNMVPLHLAIQEYSSNIDTYLPHLIADAPRSLSTREQLIRLYPFMNAAHYSKLDFCYMLSQQNPMLASRLSDDPLWKYLELMRG